MSSIHFSHAAIPAIAPKATALPSLLAWLQRIALPSMRPAEQVLPLAREARHWVRRPLGRTVTCVAGTLWLTFDGTPQDIVLEAGQSHRCRDDAALMVYALDAARVRLS